MSRREPGSLSAAINAEFRARETMQPESQRIIEDPWARRFRDGHWRLNALRLLERVWPRLRRLSLELQVAHCVRHRAIDVLVERSIACGFRQVVVAGAGYDTRALRLSACGDDVRWIELDRQSMQARKTTILPGSRAQLIAGDLQSGTLLAVLRRAPAFDPSLPTCFVLEGISQYLPMELFATTVRELGMIPVRTRVIVSLISSRQYHSAPALFANVLRWIGDIPQCHFEPDIVEEWFGRQGFASVEQWDFVRQASEFAPSARMRRPELHQLVVQADSPAGHGSTA